MESEVREDGTTLRYVSGYAVVFEQYSTPFWDEIVEIISRTAFDNTDMSDVVMVVDHSRQVGDVLARSKNGEGSLEISIDDIGVKFRFAVPDTSVGRDVVALIERGDITECSFSFWVRKDSWSYDMMVEGKRYDVRRIEDVARLADLSIVVNGQYPQTSVGIDERSLAMRARELARPKDVARQMSVSLAKAITDTF
jgi:HK97 family phage prohead protease